MASFYGLSCFVALIYLLLLAAAIYMRGMLPVLQRRVSTVDCLALPQALCTHLPGVRVYYTARPA
eukprot:3736059-Amphidinium_carterae.1